MTTANIHSVSKTEITCKAMPAVKAGSVVMVIIAVAKKAWLRIERMIRNHRTRNQLAELSDHLLDDIGLTRAQRNEEIRKPFWVDSGLIRGEQ